MRDMFWATMMHLLLLKSHCSYVHLFTVFKKDYHLVALKKKVYRVNMYILMSSNYEQLCAPHGC